jgi:hypothetical protein
MSKYPQDHPPQIPLRETAPALKKLGGGLLLAGFVLCPSVPPIFARFRLLRVLLLIPLVREQAREHEDGLYPQPFECAKIRFDALCECEGKSTGGCEKGLSREWVFCQKL